MTMFEVVDPRACIFVPVSAGICPLPMPSSFKKLSFISEIQQYGIEVFHCSRTVCRVRFQTIEVFHFTCVFVLTVSMENTVFVMSGVFSFELIFWCGHSPLPVWRSEE